MEFLLLYEKKEREMESAILLKTELEKRGYEVDLVLASDGFRKRYNFKVLITPFLYGNKEIYECAYAFGKKIDKIINLQWEQVVCKKFEQDINAWWWPHQEAKKAIHICWGENTRRMLINAGIKPENARVTGRIDLDILQRSELMISKNELADKYGLNLNKKWVLFISSFPYAVYSDAVLNNIKSNAGIDVEELIEVSKSNRAIIIEWLLCACETYDYEFIYRPHPAEICEKTREINKHKNFHIISAESIKHWLYHVDKSYNWRSTSAIESILLNKGNIILRPNEHTLSDREDFSVFDHAIRIGTKEDFMKDLLEEQTSGTSDLLYDYYFRDDQYTACKRVADVCEEVLKSSFSCGIDYRKVKQSIGLRLRMKIYMVHRFGIPFFEKHPKMLKRLTGMHILRGGLSYVLEMRKRDLISEEEMHNTELYLGLTR